MWGECSSEVFSCFAILYLPEEMIYRIEILVFFLLLWKLPRGRLGLFPAISVVKLVTSYTVTRNTQARMMISCQEYCERMELD